MARYGNPRKTKGIRKCVRYKHTRAGKRCAKFR